MRAGAVRYAGCTGEAGAFAPDAMLAIVLELLLIALTAGFVGAIFGVGGGVLLVPALTLLLHVPMRAAIGVSLISVVATSAGASAAFVRDGWTNLRVAMALEVATVSGALVGASLAAVSRRACSRGSSRSR